MRIAASIWRPFVGRAVVLGLFLGVTSFPIFLEAASSRAATETEASSVRGVTIRGNRRIETATILSYMQLPTDRTVTAEELNDAVRRLYDTGLFADVQIIPGEGTVAVEVVENPSINEIAFEGNDVLQDEDLQKLISLRSRLPFTRSAAEADAQKIIEVYRRIGRYGAQVEPVIIERSDNRVDLVFEISEGDVTGVKSIDFVGNEKFSDRKLRRVIETTESGILAMLTSADVYDPDRLELDKELLRQFYLSEGYADFTVLSVTAELSPDREGFFITFTLDEGEQYTFGALDVSVSARGLDRDEFLGILPDDLQGETYDATKVDKLTNKLTDLAGQKGFAFVQVAPRANKNTEERTIEVTFELAEGSRIFIERIDIEGNTQTLDRVIRREVQFVEGDAFNTVKIRQTRTKVRGLGYFSDVKVDTERGSADDRAVLKIRVKERPTGSLSIGAGFSTSTGPIGNVAITERNFLGRGQVVNIKVTAAGDTQVYDFAFTEPRFLDRDLLISTRAFFVQDNRTDTSSFRQTSGGISPQFGFPLSDEMRIRLRYEFQHDDVTVQDDASVAIKADAGSHITSAVGYALELDRRDDRIEPTRGFLASIDQEVAGLGGSARYVKSRGSFKTWYSFFDDDVIASIELEAGALVTFGEDSRVTQRYFLGGDSFRGFADEGIGPRDTTTVDTDALGGNYFGMARLQVSFPLGLPEELGVFGGAYLDAGTLFGLDQTTFTLPDMSVVTFDDSAKLRVAVGALLFLETPFGPLELSFGVPIIKEDFDKSEAFRLSIGTRF